jgi:hypothetical protein
MLGGREALQGRLHLSKFLGLESELLVELSEVVHHRATGPYAASMAARPVGNKCHPVGTEAVEWELASKSIFQTLASLKVVIPLGLVVNEGVT